MGPGVLCNSLLSLFVPGAKGIDELVGSPFLLFDREGELVGWIEKKYLIIILREQSGITPFVFSLFSDVFIYKYNLILL